ncbi:MAG: XRE family transcriptional regulator [Saprospirales bacterium]|nr:MAG: XRE family transcriptional regulator [Saprospirales bacterium]
MGENLKSKNREETVDEITREELLRSPEYWEEYIKIDLFNIVQDYLDKNKLSRKELADKMGVSRGYISQVLNGDSDHRLSKIVTFSLQAGKAPCIYFRDLDKVLEDDRNGKNAIPDFDKLEQSFEFKERYTRFISLDSISRSMNVGLSPSLKEDRNKKDDELVYDEQGLSYSLERDKQMTDAA